VTAATGSAPLTEARIAAYLRSRLPHATSVSVSGLYRIPGGASRETWSFDATWNEAAGPQRRGFILRRDPDASLLVTERDVEYNVYRAFATTTVPVPRVYWIESDPSVLDRPFFVMERIDGCSTDGVALVARPDDAARQAIARRKFEILGAIHCADPAALKLLLLNPEGAPRADECAARELRRWEQIIDAEALTPEPVLRLAIAWLRHHPPPSAQRVVVCHGDYRTGNFLFSADDIHGVLDWEMAHLGDPLEDFAWTCLLNWRLTPTPGERGDLIGGIVRQKEAITTYEAASGIRVDPAALHWWDVFSHVKATAIWLTGGRSFAEGRTQEPLMALIPRMLNGVQYSAILDLLGW